MVFRAAAWGHGLGFQPPGVCVHHGEHMVLALAGWWECGINFPGPLVFIFQPSSSMPERLYSLGLLDCGTCFTFMDNLCDNVHGQVSSTKANFCDPFSASPAPQHSPCLAA